jgi:purine-nucleoside/S-methyl-5'-thioadenosine phosphorylase / adenosine deaminase
VKLARPELAPGVSAVFTGRDGGVSVGEFAGLNLGGSVGDEATAVDANRTVLLDALRTAGVAQLAWMRQVHGAQVADLTAEATASMSRRCSLNDIGGTSMSLGSAGSEADAMFTDVAGLALAVLVADCAPVLLADPVAGLVGVAHAGRPGLAAGVVPALVTAMSKAGADPDRLVALIGPMICGNCYEVPAAMRDEVAALAPGSACVTRRCWAWIDRR